MKPMLRRTPSKREMIVFVVVFGCLEIFLEDSFSLFSEETDENSIPFTVL